MWPFKYLDYKSKQNRSSHISQTIADTVTMSSKICHNFLRDTDLHGLGFIGRPGISALRQTAWSLVFIASLAGFSTFAYFRVEHYFSYPYVTKISLNRSIAPAPALLVCPGDGVIMSNLADDSLCKLSDIDVLMLISFSLKIPILSQHGDGQETVFTINVEWMERLQGLQNTGDNISECFSDTGSGISSGYEYQDIQHIDQDCYCTTFRLNCTIKQEIAKYFEEQQSLSPSDSTLVQISRRLSAIPPTLLSFSASLDDIREFLKRYGYTKDNAKMCTAQVHYATGTDDAGCMSSVGDILTDMGHCLKLDNAGNKKLYLALKDKITTQPLDDPNAIAVSWFYVKLQNVSTTKGSTILSFYDVRNIPSVNLDSLSYYEDFESGLFLLERVFSSTTLNSPYHEMNCTDQERISCMYKCIKGKLPCIPLYMLNETDAVASKPLCPLWTTFGFNTSAIPAVVKGACQLKCRHACTKVVFKAKKATITDTGDEDTGVTLAPCFTLTHELYSEVPNYTIGSLMAELGGTVGLFLGASILSLYHFLEFTILLLVEGMKLRGKQPVTTWSMKKPF